MQVPDVLLGPLAKKVQKISRAVDQPQRAYRQHNVADNVPAVDSNVQQSVVKPMQASDQVWLSSTIFQNSQQQAPGPQASGTGRVAAAAPRFLESPERPQTDSASAL